MNPTESPNPFFVFALGALVGGMLVNATKRTADENEADIDQYEFEEGVKALKAKKRAQAAARAKA